MIDILLHMKLQSQNLLGDWYFTFVLIKFCIVETKFYLFIHFQEYCARKVGPKFLVHWMTG